MLGGESNKIFRFFRGKGTGTKRDQKESAKGHWAASPVGGFSVSGCLTYSFALMELLPAPDLTTKPAFHRTMESVLEGRLHNQRNSVLTENVRETRAEEKPWHKFAARAFAAGEGNAGVAALCEVTPQTITALLKNAWFQELIETYMREASKDVMERINKETFACVQVLCDIRDDPLAPKAVRANICMDFLNRKLGKPTQRTEVVSSVTSSDPVAEAERLERENAQLLGQGP